MKKINQSRRDFLTQCALLSAAGVASPFSSFGSLSMMSAVAAPPSEYRAMVCVYLVGGNDLNMLVPTDDTNYGFYQSLRGSLAIAKNDLFPITSEINGVSEPYGIHPACGGMKELYDNGNLAFVTNTGALIEPTSAETFRTKSVKLPPKIFSHNSQKDFVHAGLPFAGEKLTGWAGRIADMFKASGSTAPLNLSFSGDNIWQRGDNTVAYGLRGSSVARLQAYRDDGLPLDASRKAALASINQLQSDHLLTSEYGRILQGSLDLSDQLREGIKQQEIDLQTVFPATRSGQLFRNTARVINARKGMQMPQQNFYIFLGGWDQHASLLGRHQATLGALDGGLSAFYKALQEMGLENQVTTFTNHDFGRTLKSNGDGSDHAWGGHQIVMGGAIDGGKVYGQHPIFSPDDSQFIESRGALVPSTSTDQLSASIAKWFGDFTDSQLLDIFPNLANFNNKTLNFFK